MTILDENTFEFISRGADQTRRIGIRLGKLIQRSDVICLTGELGSGKTTLVQGVVRGWGSSEPVTSPTFVLINSYHLPEGSVLFHLDAYRLKDAMEAIVLDLDAMLAQGPLVVEWADRILSALPEERLSIQMDWLADELRRLEVTFRGKRYEEIFIELKKGILKSFE